MSTHPVPPQTAYPNLMPQPAYHVQENYPVQVVHIPASSFHFGPKKMGSFNNFFQNLIFGFFIPLISLVVVFGLETPMLSRIGVVAGHVSIFLWLACYFVSFIMFFQEQNYYYYNDESYNEQQADDRNTQIIFLVISAVFAFLFFVTFIILMVQWRRFMKYFKTPEAAPERPQAFYSTLGTPVSFILSFAISCFLPFIGSVICLCVSRSIRSRFGAVLGLSTMIFFGGLGQAFAPFSFFTGNPMLFVGLIMVESTFVHFYRLIEATKLVQQQIIYQ